MQRGIVVEVQVRHWVVMTTDGSFIKVPNVNSGVQMGEEISIQQTAPKPQMNWKIFLSGAVAALLAFFFLFPAFLGNQAQAQSYVYVEIQPSVEIGLNGKNVVVNMRPLNSEAKELVDQVEWKEEPVDQVVVEYLKKAKSQGFIRKKDPLVLSAINQHGANQTTLKTIRTTIEQDSQLGKQQLGLSIFTLSMPKVVQDAAQKSGLTPGKYGVWLLSQQLGKKIPVHDVAEKPLGDLTSDESVSTLLDNPPSEKEWKELIKEKQKAKDETIDKLNPPLNHTDSQTTTEDENPTEDQTNPQNETNANQPNEQQSTDEDERSEDNTTQSTGETTNNQTQEDTTTDPSLQNSTSDTSTTP